MWAEKLKKLTSLSLIFFLLFSITLRVPVELFLSYTAYADEREFYNLVSIVVDEDTYGDVRNKLVRYSRDIQKTLENTKVVIVPTPSDASALDIASLNESLYFEGYKAHKDVDFESRLVGTVLVGKIPVPIVFQDGNSAKSILPYVDFEEKSFIFNHETSKYEKSEEADTDLSPEVWHGVISPNTGNAGDDIDAIADYFDKNHDFYTGQGIFDQNIGVLDGTDTDAPDDYEPYVFYYDQFRENSALQYQNYIGYQMYLQNMEDITYNRYSKDLAERVKNQVLGIQNADIVDLLTQIDPEFDVSIVSNNGPDAASSSDIISRYITDNATKSFLEIFNGTTLGDMRKHVYNAGRYNEGGSKVNVDMPPFLISVLDAVSAEVVKNVNDSLERDITDIVANGLSREIIIPTSTTKGNQTSGSGTGQTITACGSNSTIFYYGTAAADITDASQCSVYRGESLSGTLVESNRGYNIDLAAGDAEYCGLGMRYDAASGRVTQGITGFWGGNTPVNLDSNSGNFDSMELGTHNLKAAIRPVRDILGSKEISDATKVSSPLNCIQDGSSIETKKYKLYDPPGDEGTPECHVLFDLPVRAGGALTYWADVPAVSPRGTTHESRACQHVNSPAATTSLESIFTGVNEAGACVTEEHIIAGETESIQRKAYDPACERGDCDPCRPKTTYNYKTIPSYILHTSPTDEEFGAQVSSLYTPSLPVDKNRYIDFIGANGQGADFGYQRIDFPHLFRISLANPSDLSLETIAIELEKHLDDVSAQINEIIRNADPASLSGLDATLYGHVDTGAYPAANVDLYQDLADRPMEIFTIDNQSKEISYLDTLIFAIYWNNLKTVSSKYKFVFENYLSNQFTGNDYNFHLPKSKKLYEAGYFAAPGDSANMYVKLDPELKGTHPYANILASNLQLNGVLTATSVANPTTTEGTFECAPPDGVNIFQWIPAVICWLKNMLPPTIKIGEGECGASLLSDDEKQEILACQGDVNNNGINDCIEDTLAEGYIVLKSNARRYFYHTPGILKTEIYNKDDEIYTFDNMSYVSTRLAKVEIPRNSENPFSGDNVEVIYDITVPELATQEARENAANYINFTDISLRSNRGTTQTYFYGKGEDVNAYFESSIKTVGTDGELAVDLTSNIQKIEVRADRVFINSYVVEDDGEYFYDNTIGVSSSENLCVLDGTTQNIEDVKGQVASISDAHEKLLLMLENTSPAGNVLPINYPISLELSYDNKTVFSESDMSRSRLQEVYPFYSAQKSGRYELSIEDATGLKSFRNIDVLPDTAVSINPITSTNIVETGGNISTHLFTILDQYDNAASGDIYIVDVSIDGDGLVFDSNGLTDITYNVVDGYRAIRLLSTDQADTNTITFTLKDISGAVISEQTREIRTINEIGLNVRALDGSPEVGGELYRYELTFTDEDGNTLSGLNSRAYMVLRELYGRPEDVYVEVENGRAEIAFRTSTLAGKNIPVEFQLEGGNDIYTHYIDILPDAPIKIDLNLSRDKIEANPTDSTILQAVLKDRYNNDVFNDDSTELTLEIHEDSRSFITVNDARKRVKQGKAKFTISGTDIPGIGYFKVTSTPDLSSNSFELIGQAPFDRSRLVIPTMTSGDELSNTGKKFFKVYTSSKYISKFITETHLTESEAYKELPRVLQGQILDFWKETNSLEVFGIGENAGSVETFFFWDKKDIDGNAYNTMYSALLGAPYGDISQENYLAGALLFDKDNSSLAVTSLLNTPYRFQDTLSIAEDGHIELINNGDITQDIELHAGIDDDGRLIFDVQNAALDAYIGRVYYNIDENSEIYVELDPALGYNFVSQGNNAEITDETGKTIFEIYENGRFLRKAGSSLAFDYDFRGEAVRVILKDGNENIGTISVSGNYDVNITRDDTLLENKLENLENTLIVHLQSNSYSSRSVYLDAESSLTKLHYHDPFANKNTLDDFHNNDITGFESVIEEAGIGWQETNTPLLSFAAGESVGDATKHFQSFSLINLGDPVVSLKALETTFRGTDTSKSFDATLGELITEKQNLIGFQTFDYNNDNREDLLTIHTDGYIDLYENKNVEGRFVKHSSLVYAVDGGSVRMVKTGDFTADGYGDIFFVTELGEPVLFNNREKDFTRIDLSEQMTLSGAIIQAETFDMDNDGNDDIVTLDDAGEIHIFYGGGTAENPEFTKNFIGDGYAITLSEEKVSHGGAVYFEGLAQVNPDDLSQLLQDAERYTNEVGEVVSDIVLDPTGNEDIPAPEIIDDSLVSGLLYVALPYIPTDVDLADLPPSEVLLETLEDDLSGIGGSPEGEALAEETGDVLGDFIESYDDYITYSGYRNGYNTQTFFLRSQYAHLENLEVSKVYNDVTDPHLQTGDIVHMDITLKNTGSDRLNNIAYVDNIPKYFNFVDNEFTVLSEDNRIITRKPGVGDYNVVIDGFYLDPGEETTIRILLKTLPLSYGHMQVGLYEQGEVGDDLFGDIVLKENEKNCGKQADIYRSIASRVYSQGTTTPTCNESDLDIGNTFPDLVDSDSDGIPDFIDNLLEEDANGNLVPVSDTDALSDYANDVLNDLGHDSDGDGIPDSDDSMDSTNSATDFMGALDQINGAIDDIAGEMDELIEGLSCGFGGGSCFANPLNWAPLAPGNDPTLFGMPIGDGLRVNEGIPIFSALTGTPVPVTGGCIEVPSVWPGSPHRFDGRCGGPNSAGGRMGVNAPTNFVRIFATPTLTGGAGIAVCFGGPALAAGNSNPMGVHPIVPGGNCIVAAKPLFGCEGGEGDPSVLGYPEYDGFGIINANCDGAGSKLYTPAELESAFVDDYLRYLKTGVRPAGLYSKYVQAMSTAAETGVGNYTLPSEPLINIGGGDSGIMSTSVDLDVTALASGNFEDVVQIKNKRIGGFPNFMMDWVERQLDEITSKLTNLPKIYVILPDFGGIFDYGWDGFGKGMKESFEKGKAEKEKTRETKNAQLEGLQNQKTGLDCSGDDALRCKTLDLHIATTKGKNSFDGAKETLSGIKEVYEFIGNIPLVDIETETIHVNVPWIQGVEIDRFLADWKYALEDYKQELNTAKNAWSFGAACTGEAAEVARCQQENDIKKNAVIQTEAFIGSFEKNIQILQEYKEFPQKLAKLINIKEVWLEQILCNIEAIASLMGGWINDNGERFKAWVELYMLIKAALKSWQLFIDVFLGYEEECHQCKNERQDLQTFIFRLISSIIPSPPIIQFPKWPDIILDFHNIRAGMTIYMPDFEMNLRPIVLPNAPVLNLPATPSVNFNLPSLPTLPQFTIPELPELPSLPTVELPDLPPPPKIPKLFGAVEAVLNIMKLVTKVMCILKQSPFVPEWRAGDQIAFLTERNGYLPTDFIDIQPPAFSYSAISAIKVTTYVNLEFEMEFIVEAVRNITAPLDEITNNISNMFQIQISDINIGEDLGTDFNVDITEDGAEIEDISFAPLNENPEGIHLVAGMLAGSFMQFVDYLAAHNTQMLSNEEFIAYVSEELASDVVVSDPRTKELQDVWNEVFDLTYSKENKFIDDLRESNREKFETLENIISTEIEYSKQQQEALENMTAPEFVEFVSGEKDGRIEAYNEMMQPHNLRSLDAAISLVSGESKEQRDYRENLEESADDLMKTVRGGLSAYRENIQTDNLLADHVPGHTAPAPSEPLTCSATGKPYKYTYEGIYVLENGRNYKLFDYTDLLRGDEKPHIIDTDGDSDNDVIYLMGGKLYFKENRSSEAVKTYVTTPPLILTADDNKFFNGDTYYEAVNGFSEAHVSDGSVNIEFTRPTDTSLKNFRMTYHTVVDRYLDLTPDYEPESVETHVVDAIALIPEDLTARSGTGYSISKNVARLGYVGAMSDLKLTTEKLQNIKTQLADNTTVALTAGARVYAGANAFRLEYSQNDETQEITVPAYSFITFEHLVNITGISGDGYVSLGILEDVYGTDIIDYIGMPLSLGSKISFDGDTSLLTESAHVDIRYYDDSELALDMRDVRSYTLYDLGDFDTEQYKIRLDIPNDFYYAKIRAFANDVLGTHSKQILLSPQKEADIYPPQIGLNQKIRVPVYQREVVDLTPYIYEDGGLSGIEEVRVDFDLSNDLDGDGNPKNDADTENIEILRTPAKIEIAFGAYEELFTKEISIALVDTNGNIGEKKVEFEVYTPDPEIQEIEDNIISGRVDETLLDEPVRLYRYRGGVIEKLQRADGSDVIQTDESGNYEFETVSTASGLTLTYSGQTLASIDEYSGQIDLESVLASIDVVASNDTDNQSVYPEIRVLFAGNPIFRQFVRMPQGAVIPVSDYTEIDSLGIYLKLLDQADYKVANVPLGVPVNPGSASIYRNDDPQNTPLMTVFNDGRIHLDIPNYDMIYRSEGDDTSLILIDTSSGKEIAQVVFHMEASYILR